MIFRELYTKLWGQKFLTELESEDRLGLYRATLAFCFRTIGANAFSAHVVAMSTKLGAEYTNTELRHWVRDNILYNGYLMRNLKFFVFALCTRPEKGVKECAERFGVLGEDMCIEKLLTQPLIDKLVSFKSRSDGINFYSLNDYNKLLEEVWTQSHSWIARMCWRKLRFIANSTGVDVEDLQTEVMTEALRAVNHTWPNIPCELYAHNLFKRTAHNVAMNMIERSMSKKHARLVKSGDGFMQLNVDYEGVLNNQGDDPALCIDTRESLDLKVDVGQFISKLTQKKRKFLESLIGTQLEFCSWLQSNDLITENQDNEDYLKTAGLTGYLKKVAEWLEIQHKQARAFLNYIRQYFTVYHAHATC